MSRLSVLLARILLIMIININFKKHDETATDRFP